MAILSVGAGQTYSTVSAAVNAARDGDVVQVQAGTYVNDFATINKDITIAGVGGMANFVATVAPPNGKGIFVTNGNVTIQDLSFSGAAVPDMNGAGIRYEGGNLVIIDSYFHHNQDGLLANSDPDGTIRIVNSEFAYNGAGDGQSHNIYVNNIASLVIDNSYFHDAAIGHQIKSRAQSTTVTNSRIYDGTGTGSYSIDLPNGGKGIIQNNVIQQGPNTDNPSIIHYGGESAAYAGSSLLISGNVFVNDKTGTALLLNNATTVTGTLSGNSVYGLSASQITNGGESTSGTTYLSTSPTLDSSAPWLGGGSDPSPTLGTSGNDTLEGTAGADTMKGLSGDDTYVVNNTGDVVVECQRPGHRPGAEFGELQPRRPVHREPDPDGHRRHQRHRQFAGKRPHRQRRQQCPRRRHQCRPDGGRRGQRHVCREQHRRRRHRGQRPGHRPGSELGELSALGGQYNVENLTLTEQRQDQRDGQ